MLKITVEVESLKAHVYDARPRSKGEKYRMEQKDVHVMTIMGKVKAIGEPKSEQIRPRTPRYNRRDMRAED